MLQLGWKNLGPRLAVKLVAGDFVSSGAAAGCWRTREKQHPPGFGIVYDRIRERIVEYVLIRTVRLVVERDSERGGAGIGGVHTAHNEPKRCQRWINCSSPILVPAPATVIHTIPWLPIRRQAAKRHVGSR